MEERWVQFSGPSSVKAERRNRSSLAVLMVVGTVAAAAGSDAAVVAGRNSEVAGRIGC